MPAGEDVFSHFDAATPIFMYQEIRRLGFNQGLI